MTFFAFGMSNGPVKVRLKDLSARAGVAINTASTILNRRSKSWASRETSERVFRAAEELGYRPNRAALGLRLGRFHAVALLLSDLRNPFYTTFADALSVALERRGYDFVIEPWRNDLRRERHRLEEVVNRQVDGVVAFLSDEEVHLGFLREQKMPFVIVGSSQSSEVPVDMVRADFTGGLRDTVARLYALGHRRFAYLCALSEGQADGGRAEFFQRLMADFGIDHEGFVFMRCGASLEDAHLTARALLANRRDVTAVLALNDFSAMGVIRAALDLGLSVPRDLSVAGVDDIPISRFLAVKLATIAQPIEEMAGKAAEMVVGRIEGTMRGPAEQAWFSAPFCDRESVAAVRREVG